MSIAIKNIPREIALQMCKYVIYTYKKHAMSISIDTSMFLSLLFYSNLVIM